MMKKIISLCISILLLLSTQVSVYAINFNFEDVSKEAWYYNDVNESVQLGLMQGYSSTVFAPGDNLTLSQAIKLASTVHSKLTGKVISTSQNGHWVMPYYSYAIVNGIVPDVYSAEDWDVIISRRQMASLFAKAIPDSEYVKINDYTLSREFAPDPNLKKLFEMGILIGSDNGFNAEANITRAETSAIINRVLNSDNRVKVENAPANEKVWVNPKTYNPKLLYVSEPIDNTTKYISLKEFEGSKPIYVLYNHTYNSANQEEYDAVVSTITRVYLEVMNDYKPSSKILQFMEGTLPKTEIEKDYVQKLLKEFPNDKKTQIECLQFKEISTKVLSVLYDDYIRADNRLPASGIKEISAYACLFSQSDRDCEAWTALHMAVYDIIGYNTCAFGSQKAVHMDVGVQFGETWYTGVYGGLLIPLDEAKQYLPDITQDVYTTLGDMSSSYYYAVKR